MTRRRNGQRELCRQGEAAPGRGPSAAWRWRHSLAHLKRARMLIFGDKSVCRAVSSTAACRAGERMRRRKSVLKSCSAASSPTCPWRLSQPEKPCVISRAVYNRQGRARGGGNGNDSTALENRSRQNRPAYSARRFGPCRPRGDDARRQYWRSMPGADNIFAVCARHRAVTGLHRYNAHRPCRGVPKNLSSWRTRPAGRRPSVIMFLPCRRPSAIMRREGREISVMSFCAP